MSERYHSTATCSPAQQTTTYTPWTKFRSLPPHLARMSGPFAIPPIGKTPEAPSEKAVEEEKAVKEERPVPPPEIQTRTETDPADSAPPVEQERPKELDRIQSKVALWDSEERQVQARARPGLEAPLFKASDQIHVMGLDLAGRYIAHTLAGCQTIPPVRYMLHKHYLYKQWHTTNKRQLTLYRGDTSIVHRRVIAEYIAGEDAEYQPARLVDNLIVTLPASQVVQAIGQIRHRLDHRSTICLVNDGLGVAEALIDTYFPDEARRPIFLLGHFTTSLGHTDSRFSVSEVRPGRLFLSLFTPQRREAGQRFRIKRHPPLERTTRAMHFIRLLSAMPGLNATGHPMADFLRYKLPKVAFRTIVDPLAALLNCRYDYLPTNPYARQLMDRLVGELSRVVSLLPECKESRKLRQFAVSSSLRDEVFHKLMLQRTADSKMRAQVGRGWDTDVDFLSGYFVRRGREVQANVTALDSVMWAVKAKQVVMLEKLGADIPYEATQSEDMGD